jgi:hypothetical protein
VSEPRLAGEWRIGDVVVVNEKDVVTSLGEGPVIDLECHPGTNAAVSALVRFNGGPLPGVWYSVGNLRQIRDLHGRAISSEGLTRVPPPVPRRKRGGHSYRAYVSAPMPVERIEELRAQANEQDADPYDDSQALHECLDVIEALQKRWQPIPEAPPKPTPAQMARMAERIQREEAEVEAEEEAEEALQRAEMAEASAESTRVVRCTCTVVGPLLCSVHAHEPCDTVNCNGVGGVVCLCGTKACPTCTETIHVHCTEDMN